MREQIDAADAVADGDQGGVAALAALTSVVIHAEENGGRSQAPHQRVGGECLRRLMSMLPCAMDSSTAPSAALAVATERPSAMSAAIVRVGYGAPDTNCDCHERRVESPRVWVTRTGDKACDRGARARQEPRIVLGVFGSNSGTKIGVVSDGELDGDDDAPVMVETVQVGAKRAAASIVVVVIDRRGSATTARIATLVAVGEGERRQRPFQDPRPK